MTHMRPWDIFFTSITVIVVVTLMIPAAFGLQNFTQWGGMYTNSWCSVWVYQSSPYVVGSENIPKERQVAGMTDGSRFVWYGNQHNEQTCALWARTRCGRASAAGWTIHWVVPVFKEKFFLGQGNACDVQPPNSFDWFHYDS